MYYFIPFSPSEPMFASYPHVYKMYIGFPSSTSPHTIKKAKATPRACSGECQFSLCQEMPAATNRLN